MITEKEDNFKKNYNNCLRWLNYDSLGNLFDVTNSDGIWLATVDKILYKFQKETKGSVGYSTER